MKKDDQSVQLYNCKLCNKGPTPYRFPSGYRQIVCFGCEVYVGGKNEQDVIKQWQQLNKAVKS